MALNMFLQLEGIPGPETDPNHTGAIDVLAYSWGLSHSPPIGSTKPKPNFQDFSLTVYEDVYSPLLFKACILGTVIKSANLSVVRANSDYPDKPEILFQFTGVRVTSISSGGSGGEDRFTQNVTLDYGSVRYGWPTRRTRQSATAGASRRPARSDRRSVRRTGFIGLACSEAAVSSCDDLPMPEPPALVGLDDVEAAARLLEGVVRRTPLEHSRVLADQVGGPVWLKCENLQRSGSFKLRGAYTRIARLSAPSGPAGVVTASAGNHAQGVALAARVLGIRATVFMPETAALPKLAATRGYGAVVRQVGATLTEALVAAALEAERTGAVFVHPFDHPDVIAGQGTVGLEVLEQCPDVATVVVCTGGGGLVSGIAVAVKALRPDVRVVAVQAEGAAAFPGSLAGGRAGATAVDVHDGRRHRGRRARRR